MYNFKSLNYIREERKKGERKELTHGLCSAAAAKKPTRLNDADIDGINCKSKGETSGGAGDFSLERLRLILKSPPEVIDFCLMASAPCWPNG